MKSCRRKMGAVKQSSIQKSVKLYSFSEYLTETKAKVETAILTLCSDSSLGDSYTSLFTSSCFN